MEVLSSACPVGWIPNLGEFGRWEDKISSDKGLRWANPTQAADSLRTHKSEASGRQGLACNS